MTSKIDRLGLLQAQAAPLLTKIETLKDEIAAELGVGSHEGQWYRVSVVDAVRSTLPIKVARAKLKALGVAARWFRDHTVYTPYTSVTCEARTGHNIRRSLPAHGFMWLRDAA